jgi:site-specific DNA recombinase
MQNGLNYIRISREDKRNPKISPDGQAETIEREAKQHGITLVQSFVDLGVSGYVPLRHRPQGKLLVARLEAEPMPVLCLRTDRMFRRVSDASRMFEIWNKTGVKFTPITEIFDVGSPQGFAFAIMAVVFAQLERDMGSLRMKATKDHLRKEGKILSGSAPYGWRANAEKILEKDPVEYPIRCRILRLQSFDHGPGRIATILNGDGVPTRSGKPWHKDTVRDILRREGRGGKAKSNDPAADYEDEPTGPGAKATPLDDLPPS